MSKSSFMKSVSRQVAGCCGVPLRGVTCRLVCAAVLAVATARGATGQIRPISGVETSPILTTPLYPYSGNLVFDGRWHIEYTAGFAAGDHSFYSVTSQPRGEWPPGGVCFGPTWLPQSFDGGHVADSNTVWHGASFVKYYTGFPVEYSWLPKTSAIGAVQGSHPSAFTRPNFLSHAPIITAYDYPKHKGNPSREYGAGQMMAVSRADDGHLYLFYCDSTARASDGNGGGLYAIRSKDPLFRGAVEELTANRWVGRAGTGVLARDRSIWPVISADIAWIPTTRQWLLAFNGENGATHFAFFSENFSGTPTIIKAPGVNWVEGPGLARTWSGYTLPHWSGRTDRLTLIWTYPVGDPRRPETWDLWLASMEVALR